MRSIITKLNNLQHALTVWSKLIKDRRAGLKRALIRKLEGLVKIECDDETLFEFIDHKIQLN